MDIFNNVVYNWGSRATDGGAHEVNFVNNYYKPGAATSIFTALKAQYESFPGTQQYYFEGNVMPGYFNEFNQPSGKIYTGTPDGYSPWVDAPFFESDATVHSADEAYKNVLSDIGCIQPVLDDHDIRMISETLHGTYSFSGSISKLPGLPDSELDVGGYENYPEESRDSNWDTDNDGLPNWWEEYFSFNANSALNDFSEVNSDSDGDGYTNLDDYLQWMMKPHYFIKVDEEVEINLSDLFRGFTNDPVYSYSSESNCSIVINGEIATLIPVSCGLASVTIAVEDGDGHSMIKELVAFIRPDAEGNCTNGISNGISLRKQADIGLFPNPVCGGVINLYSQIPVENIESIAIYSVMGNQVRQKSPKEISGDLFRLEIPIVDIGKGVYFVQIQIEGHIIVLPFVKQ